MNDSPKKPASPVCGKSFLTRCLNWEMPKWFDELVFHSRWLLYPAIAGLVVVDLVFLAVYLYRVWQFVVSAVHMVMAGETPELTIQTIDLLDQALTLTLVVLIVMGIHQIYIRKFREDRQIHDIPQWLDHIDTVFLKVKIGLSFSVISGVQLLKDGMTGALIPHEEWIRHLVNHGVFVATTVAFAFIWRLTHPPYPAHPADVKRAGKDGGSEGTGDGRVENKPERPTEEIDHDN